MRKLLNIALLATLIFVACTSEDISLDKQDDKSIEIFLSVSNYQISNASSRSTRSIHAGSNEEKEVENLYLFLFDTNGSVEKYNVTGTSFSGGTWSVEEGKITLNLTQITAAIRDVYIVANYPSSLQGALDGVTTVSELLTVAHNQGTPWSPDLGTPILMTGNVNGHNFISNRQLNNVPLTRAVAKLELNIKLTAERQSTPTIEQGVPGSGNTSTVHQYGYQFVDFDKNTYAYKQTQKVDDLESFANMVNFTETDDVAKYILTGDVVTGLTLITYLNERDSHNGVNPRSSVELRLPYNSGGPLPPPEFGDEIYKLQLPTIIERNTWYVYDIEI